MPRVNTVNDIWSYIDVKSENECWNWKKSTADWRGYGQTHFQGKHIRAHRLIFKLTHGGYLPPAVMHSCDNPSCCNPAHLIAGTNGLNNKDRALKGRSNSIKGSDHHAAKLTREDVIFIRSKIASKEMKQKDLAEMFGLHRNHVSDIVKRKRWAWLE